MTGKSFFVTILAAFCFCVSGVVGGDASGEGMDKATELLREGNYRDAAELFRTVALDRTNGPRDVASSFDLAVACYARLNRLDDATELFDRVRETWKDSWRVVYALAASRQLLMVSSPAPRSLRPPGVGGERQRAQTLELLLEAETLFDDGRDPADAADKADLYAFFADTLLQGRTNRRSWRLAALTDIPAVAAAEDDTPPWSVPERNAPVNEDGTPVYHRVPASWADAKTDGERWRWILERLAEHGGAEGRAKADLRLGAFLLQQFGVQTMVINSPMARNADIGGETGPFAVRTLEENETIARLANGMKRFAMPDGFNHIKVLRRVAESGIADAEAPAAALLAGVFENRQQYHKAVSFWTRLKDLPVRTIGNSRTANELGLGQIPPRSVEQALERITGNNGLLEPGPVAPAGSVTGLSYLFRNGKSVRITAKRLDERKLLRDIRDRINARDADIMENMAFQRPEAIGRAVMEDGGDRYVAGVEAEWDVALEPLPDYYSRRTRIDLPFTGAGCYLIEAAMRDGNVSRVVLWIADLALVRKSAGPHQILFVADAVSGEPVPSANLTCMGYRNEYTPETDTLRIDTDVFAERTDVEGLAIVDAGRFADKSWLIIAEDGGGRLAYLGFEPVWGMDRPENQDGNESLFLLSDRPVYRPGQEIKFKVWLGDAGYSGKRDAVPGRSVEIAVMNPRGESVYRTTLVTDAFGAVDGSITLDADAPLGMYQATAQTATGRRIYGYLGFRLEEYKKPEFTVDLETPASAIELGDSAQVKVRAKYYYGAPVQDATVKYKIVRTTFTQTWTPPWRWDWLYGSGAWAAGPDHSWYPGYSNWGGAIPAPPWLPRPFEQPEVVAEGEGVVDADGVFRVLLDTLPAKELLGGRDHSYEITAEVTDRSRRTIVGGGKVVASRHPFTVSVTANRGYYDAGQEVRADIRAVLPLGGGVKAEGVATLYRITYDPAGTPHETAENSRRVETDKDGAAVLRFAVDAAGQYRLSCRLDAGGGKPVEGAALLTVRGKPGEGDFRFAALELVPDKREYKPGETVRLAINSEHKGGMVLFLPRAERFGDDDGSGGVHRPALVRMENGSRILDIPVGRSDQPNFFCEAVTVYKGRVYVETREIFVPPVDKTLAVEVEPDKESYASGERATFSVRVTDADGKPVAGQCAVTLYDKSVEYISGGSNVGDIRAHFWSWKRHYGSSVWNSLSRRPYSPQRKGDVFWQPIGVFGGQEADWNDDGVHTNGRMQFASAGFGGGASVMRMRAMALMENRADATALPPPAPMMAAPVAEMDMALSQEAAPATGGMDAGDGMAEAAVRSEFADTALWIASLETDADGMATFSLDMPENLTAWKARTWVMGRGTSVGEGGGEVETRKNVIIRPQMPRFLTQKDRVVLSANLHNYLPRAKRARAEIVLEGGVLELADGQEAARSVDLAANGEARADWIVDAVRPGEATVVMKLFTDEESDASEAAIPVIVHGARTVRGFGGIIRGGDAEAAITVRVPGERLPERSRLELSFSPSVAAPMLDALPYLIEYPYGCTEQTLNRFLPVVTARKFLDDLGVNLADAKKRLDAARVDEKAEEWKKKWGDPRSDRGRLPVFDDAELEKMVKQGIERLSSMQNADGGWGWFSGSGERSWPHTTAVVVYGLQLAERMRAPIPMGVLDDGVNWLRRRQAEQVAMLKAGLEKGDEKDGVKRKARADDTDAFVYMILAADSRRAPDPDMRDFLYRDRLELSKTGLVMLGLALHAEGATGALDMVLRNLDQYVRTDPVSGAAWLDVGSGGWWWWYNDDVETQAWYLKLLSRVDAKGDTASGVARYLLRNRKNGSYWRSTRDTANAIEALAEYAKASGESGPDGAVTVFLDGRQVMRRRLAPESVLDDTRFVLEGLAVEEGEHELRIVREGSGNIYFGGALDVFSLEDPIRAAGSGLRIEREFFRLVPVDAAVDAPTETGTVVRNRVERYRRVGLPGVDDAGGSSVFVESGELVEVELTIVTDNDYEYLVFEDMKAAGLEAVELRSGYSGNGMGAYVEYRDQKVVLFVRWLPRGEHRIAYRFRAEVPGRYSALPTFGGGMYATDLFANSDEMKMGVSEEGIFEK